ncbi:MAG TPA: GNAT family N-acetyltransferase [Candidatus Dormibacteraeota bacterium]
MDPTEWESLREIRLKALADAPQAFGSTLAQELARPEAAWRERAEPSAGGCTWTARTASGWVGLVGAFVTEGRVQLVSMWVAPGWRRRGVARALIAAVVAWFGESGQGELYLRVGADNLVARRCYEAAGFRLVETPSTRPRGPGSETVEMTWSDLG